MAGSAYDRAAALRHWQAYTGRQVRSQVIVVSLVTIGAAAFASLSYHSPMGRRPRALPIAGLAALMAAWAVAALCVFGALRRELARAARAVEEDDLTGYLRHAGRGVGLARWMTSLLGAASVGAGVGGLLLELRPADTPRRCVEALEDLRSFPRPGEKAGRALRLGLFLEVREALLAAASGAATGEESCR